MSIISPQHSLLFTSSPSTSTSTCRAPIYLSTSLSIHQNTSSSSTISYTRWSFPIYTPRWNFSFSFLSKLFQLHVTQQNKHSAHSSTEYLSLHLCLGTIVWVTVYIHIYLLFLTTYLENHSKKKDTTCICYTLQIDSITPTVFLFLFTCRHWCRPSFVSTYITALCFHLYLSLSALSHFIEIF